MKSKNFKSMFIISFIKTLAFSLMLTLLCITIWVYLVNNLFLPANYYEKQVPDIVESITKINVLDKNNKDKIDKLVPSPFVEYQVFDKYGNLFYTSDDTSFLNEDKDFLKVINTTTYLKGNSFYKVFPLTNENNEFYAAVGILYSLSSNFVNKNNIFNYLSKFFIFLPFIFITLFSIYYARKISNKLKKPLDELSLASQKIENEELNFNLEYDNNDEFKDLFNAFESMRSSLESSLHSQWEIENLRKENLSNIAHDLKTPLTVIKTYSEAISFNMVPEDKITEYANIINRNGDRALKMVMDINMITKLENLNYKLNPIYVNIKDFFTEKLSEYKYLLEENNFSLEVDILDLKNNSKNYYDLNVISIILDNIISNSTNYSKGNKISIKIKIESDLVNVTIKDNGIGFSEKDLKYATTKFYRGDDARKNSGSTGLGLYISNRLSNIHRGNLYINNNIDGGSLVCVEFRPIDIKKQ